MSNTHVESGPRLPPIASALMGTLAENWWLLLLRGLAAIAFGVLAFFWPGLTLAALIYLCTRLLMVTSPYGRHSALRAATPARAGGSGSAVSSAFSPVSLPSPIRA